MKPFYARLLLAAMAACLTGVAVCQPRFSVVQDHGVSWLQDAKGRKFWSFGCCVVDPGTKFDDYDINNPAYAAWRFFLSKPAWARDAVATIGMGGFNTIGAWSDYRALLDLPGYDFYMTPINHMGSGSGFPWTDMWDPANVATCDAICKDQVALLKKDPRVIGYFSDNELGWWKPALFGWIWKQKTLNTRRRAVDLLEKRYGTWQRFSADFDVDGADSFEELRRVGRPFLATNCHGIGAITEVLGMLAHRYYTLCHDIIKKYDPDALYLGDRYISNYYPEVATEAGKYCDVVSTNLNANWTDGGFVHCHLDGLEELTHKPLMVTEYYMTSKAGRSGNGNDHSGFPVVDTLDQRAKGFANETKAFLSRPYMVGAHWFQYYDEPKLGRGDGENYNFGLVDVDNKPYKELLDTARGLDFNILHTAGYTLPTGRAFVKAPTNLLDLTTWNRDPAFVPADQKAPRGDLYVAPSPAGLTLGLFWYEERFTNEYFKDNKVPDAALSTIEIDMPGAAHIKIQVNGKDSKVLQGKAVILEASSDPAAKAVITIPGASADTLMQVTLRSECKAYKTTWFYKG